VGAPASAAADGGGGLGGGDPGWESGAVTGRYAAGSARANLNPRQKMALQQARRQGREGHPAGLATATMTTAAASAAAAEYVRQGLEAVRAQEADEGGGFDVGPTETTGGEDDRSMQVDGGDGGEAGATAAAATTSDGRTGKKRRKQKGKKKGGAGRKWRGRDV
jgi:hypothetical protein